MRFPRNPTTRRPRRRGRFRSHAPPLRFTPTAWAKLVYLRDLGETEVGGFAISRENELLCVEDVRLVRQICSPTSVIFDDESVADFFDSQVDAGRSPEEFGRIWMHTHPGNCPQPSLTDEETFARVFGGTEWAVMFILAQGGATYARLQIQAGPGAVCRLPVEIDFRPPFGASDEAAWGAEYAANVLPWQAVLARDQRAAEVATTKPPAVTDPSNPVLYESPDEWPPEWRDPFYCSDDPPFDFELQRSLADAQF